MRKARIAKFLAATSFLAIAASFAAFALPVAAESIYPRLTINIPSVNFTRVAAVTAGSEAGISGYIDIPWIAEYVKGVYSYAVTIAGLIAGVMIVIGGFFYLTAGGDASRVQKGKQKIADALVGLLLVYAAYAALAAISPGLTSFEVLRVKTIQSSPYTMTMHSVMTTTVSTGAASTSAGTTGSPPPFVPPPGAVDAPNTPLPPPSGNNYVQLYTTCPVEAQIPAKNGRACRAPWPASMQCGEESPSGPRGTAFRDAMRALIASEPNVRRKIAMVAEAGIKCFGHFGSCGATATTWQAIAGVGADRLGSNEPSSGGTTRWNGVSHETPSALAWPILGVACNTVCGGSRFRDSCGARCDPATRANGTVIPNEYKVVRDCASGAAAKAAVRAMFEGPGGPAGWPDSWTSQLEIGDFVIIYNGNSSCGASHAQIFLGWMGGGRARMGNGQWGGPQWLSTDCLMRSCGNFSIVTKIFKPKTLAH